MSHYYHTAKYERAKAIVSKYLGRYGMMSGWEAEELAQAYKDIDEVRRVCGHLFEKYQSFSQVVRKCRYCDQEDPT